MKAVKLIQRRFLCNKILNEISTVLLPIAYPKFMRKLLQKIIIKLNFCFELSKDKLQSFNGKLFTDDRNKTQLLLFNFPKLLSNKRRIVI